MEKLDLFKCEICGNLCEMVLVGGGELICCGQPMKKLEPQTEENSMMEKHVPIFINHEDNIEIRVGEVLHPMLEEHHIVFIEAISEDKNKIHRQYLYAGNEPKMFLKEIFTNGSSREFCNIHGLWEGKQ